MEFFEVLNTRRSIRSFLPDLVTREEVEVILHAACMAPSARNRQPWHFAVIDRPEMLEQIAERHPFAKFANRAPMAIVVCAVPEKGSRDFWVQDCSAATMNLLLAARALGLGTVWCGLYPEDDRQQILRDILHTPENIQPFSLIIIGRTDKTFTQAERDARPITQYNAWE